ncbi:MAG TPA: response regulator transcription factor [Actinomycetota bacterium]
MTGIDQPPADAAPGVHSAADPVQGTIRVGIIDDHRMVREGLRTMLREQPRVDIVGEAEDQAGALRMIEECTPEIVLLDIRLKGASGLDTCRVILQRFPELKIIFLTVYEDEQYIFEALRAGASGYILKKISDDDLVKVIEQVRSGETIVDPALTGQVALRAASRSQSLAEARFGLSPREAEVLGLVTQGMTNHQIAEQLFIGEETVKSHVRAILRKLSVKDRTQAVSLALREGLVK